MQCFFFFRQKTAYEMRISDWSSDVCSSDLMLGNRHAPAFDGPHHVHLRLSGHMADYAPAMCQKTQRPRRCDRWIKLPERAGRCVAGIGEYLSADVRLPLIEGREIGLRHIDFAPHTAVIRRALRPLLGTIPDR